jgi:hypothetical protein
MTYANFFAHPVKKISSYSSKSFMFDVAAVTAAVTELKNLPCVRFSDSYFFSFRVVGINIIKFPFNIHRSAICDFSFLSLS